MNSPEIQNLYRRVAINGLAAVGFIALLAGGMWLAVYSARYVPMAVNSLGAAAVTLSGVFVPASSAGLLVVPTSSTTIPLGSSPAISSPVPPTLPEASATMPAAGNKTSAIYPIGATASTPTPVLSGLPDLVVSITNVGYLTSTSTGSFVASSTVPNGSVAAVQFTIKNVGAGATGAWRFSASIPTQTSYIFQSPPQQSLNPGESIDYTLGFDQANKGAGQTISITANFDHVVAESDSTNDSASAKITVIGS